MTANAPRVERWYTPAEVAAALNMSVYTLRAQLAIAPANLPGAPALMGLGAKNRYLRWRSIEDAERWLAAFTEWRAEVKPSGSAPSVVAPTARPSRRAARPAATDEENTPVNWARVHAQLTVRPERGTRASE